MSTRCNITLHREGQKPEGNDGVILYHHSDGYPDFQLRKIVDFLEDASKKLSMLGYSYWWDPSRVSAMMVFLSAGRYESPGLPNPDCWEKKQQATANHEFMKYEEQNALGYGYPVYQPTSGLHGDIEYIYRIFLGSEDENKPNHYRIEIYRPEYSHGRDEVTQGEHLGTFERGQDVEAFIESLSGDDE